MKAQVPPGQLSCVWFTRVNSMLFPHLPHLSWYGTAQKCPWIVVGACVSCTVCMLICTHHLLVGRAEFGWSSDFFGNPPPQTQGCFRLTHGQFSKRLWNAFPHAGLGFRTKISKTVTPALYCGTTGSMGSGGACLKPPISHQPRCGEAILHDLWPLVLLMC